MRFLTFVSRPVDSVEFGGLGLASVVSAGAFEKRPDSLLLDFFLSPGANMVGVARKYGRERCYRVRACQVHASSCVFEDVICYCAAPGDKQKAMQGFGDTQVPAWRRFNTEARRTADLYLTRRSRQRCLSHEKGKPC
jgi:hypothetical protein